MMNLSADKPAEDRFALSQHYKSAIRSFYTAITLFHNPRVLVPSLIYILIQIAVMFGYLSSIEEPWTTFWSIFIRGLSADDLGHFPTHLILMNPVLGRVDILLDIFIHIIFQAATVVLVSSAFRNRRVSLVPAFRRAGRLYPKLLVVSIIGSTGIFAAVNLPGYIARGSGSTASLAMSAAGIVTGLAMQILLLYSIPLIVLEGTGALRAIAGSVRFAWKHVVTSIILVVIPFIITLPTTFLSLKSEMIAIRLSPDFMIHNHIASSIMLMFAVYLITAGGTVFYVHRTAKE